MTASMNKVFLLGNLGNDPKFQTFESGNQRATFNLAVNETYKSNGDTTTTTHWFRITAWNSLAKVISDHLTKGSTVLVEGKLVTGKIGQGDDAITTIDIRADKVQFIHIKPRQPAG